MLSVLCVSVVPVRQTKPIGAGGPRLGIRDWRRGMSNKANRCARGGRDCGLGIRGRRMSNEANLDHHGATENTETAANAMGEEN